MYPPHDLNDFTPGQHFVTGSITLTQSQIIDFALTYDPQPFHISILDAEQSAYGGLIASGFQTLSICFRLYVQTGLFLHSSLGSPGLDEVRWYLPVRPDDTLSCTLDIIEIKPSRSKPDRGIARILVKAFNQRGETVASFYINHLLKCRPESGA